MKHIEPIARLINELTKLPGVGMRTAERFCYAIIKMAKDEAKRLAAAITDVKEKVAYCSVCGNFTDSDPCFLCKNRSVETICVVKEPKDVAALEKGGVFKGAYHVLHGTINPIEGIGPNDIRIKELVARLESGKVKEIIIALNTDAEGDATAMYAAKLINPLGVKVTRIAQGIPIGSDIEFADEVTLLKAIEDRRELK